MASSKASKKRKQQQAQRRQQHNAAESRQRQAEHTHLPKTGTAADDEYLLRRSREDVVDFGMAERKRGWVNVAVVVVVLAAVAALVLFFTLL